MICKYDTCSGLTSVTIPNSVTSIERCAFSGCSCLTSVTIPNSVTSIEEGVFNGCSGLTSVTIPNSVTSIGKYAFKECSGLTSVIIPNSVTSIEMWAFYYCSGLTSVTIPNSVTSIEEGVFNGCSGLTSVTIPNSVTSIGGSDFKNCSGLTSVTIPNSVTGIGGSAFSGCSGLTSVTIPNSVTYMGDYVFCGCPEIKDVYSYAEKVPRTYSNAFEGSYIEYATLHVPSSAVNAYKAVSPWKDFKSIVAIDDDTPKCEKPTISYENGQLKMSCATESVEYVTDITDADIKKHYDATISLTATYNISVYATKTGYDNSDIATATLCWIETEPKNEDLTDKVEEVKAYPVLIQSKDGQITVQGVADKAKVAVYTIDGVEAGNGVANNGVVSINTNINSGEIAIIKIGEKSVKVLVK